MIASLESVGRGAGFATSVAPTKSESSRSHKSEGFSRCYEARPGAITNP